MFHASQGQKKQSTLTNNFNSTLESSNKDLNDQFYTKVISQMKWVLNSKSQGSHQAFFSVLFKTGTLAEKAEKVPAKGVWKSITA